MKVVHLSTSDIDGGAARAAYRLHTGLNRAGIWSLMYVGTRKTDDSTVSVSPSKLMKGYALAAPFIDRIPLLMHPNRTGTLFSTASVANVCRRRLLDDMDPDIVHLHWVCNGFLGIGRIGTIGKPIVWTLHDMWPFTGGCHYAGECNAYRSTCGRCPQLDSERSCDLSRLILHRKHRFWRRSNLTIVCPSSWMSSCAMSSSLFKERRIEVIPNGIDPARFRPVDKAIARDLLSLPQSKKLMLFGAMHATSDPRKGFPLMQEMLGCLSARMKNDDLELVVFGSSQQTGGLPNGILCHYRGLFHDELSLALLYAACDVFVAPSLQDNLPNTVMEAMACGTPSAAFRIGGMPDMIEHGVNGVLARPFDPDDLAQGVAWMLERRDRWASLSRQARHTVETRYAIDIVGKQYSNLYDELVRPGTGMPHV